MGNADLIAFEDGIRSRLALPKAEADLDTWILFSPYTQRQMRASAFRYRWLAEVEDIVSDARLILLGSLGRASNPVLRWDERSGSGFWPTVFRKKVEKAVEGLRRRRKRPRQVDTDQLACDQATAKLDRIPSELWADVEEAATELEPRLRQVVILVGIKGASYSVAAEIMGAERHAISRWNLEAVQQLRSILNPDAVC